MIKYINGLLTRLRATFTYVEDKDMKKMRGVGFHANQDPTPTPTHAAKKMLQIWGKR